MSFYQSIMITSKCILAKYSLKPTCFFVLHYTYLEVINMYPRIRRLRENKNMTQIEMAKLLHCSQRVYSNYECGKVDIPVSILICLANIHQTSVDYLLDLTDEKMPHPRIK